MSEAIDKAALDPGGLERDPGGLERVLGVFERNYSLSSADFYRAHMRDEPPAADLSPWHREIWSGAYRQWLRKRGAAQSWQRTG